MTTKRTEPIHVACPTCNALPGNVCRERYEVAGTVTMLWTSVHSGRIEAARERDDVLV